MGGWYISHIRRPSVSPVVSWGFCLCFIRTTKLTYLLSVLSVTRSLDLPSSSTNQTHISYPQLLGYGYQRSFSEVEGVAQYPLEPFSAAIGLELRTFSFGTGMSHSVLNSRDPAKTLTDN